MVPFERLAEVFDRGLRDGVGALIPSDREVFRIQDFIIEFEMGGLSGYFYNRVLDLDGIVATVAAMRSHGLTDLARLVGDAAELFAEYTESDSASTWDDVLRKYDPKKKLAALEMRITALDDYGLAESSIS